MRTSDRHDLRRRRSFGICRQAKWGMTSEAKSTRVSPSFRSPLISRSMPAPRYCRIRSICWMPDMQQVRCSQRAALRGAGARHRSKVGALPARLSGARHLLAAPDTGAGGNALVADERGRLPAATPAKERWSADRRHGHFRLSVEPDGRQILVYIKTRTDSPAFDIGTVDDDTVLPQREELVGLVVEHIFLKIAKHCALPFRIRLMQHLLVEIDLVLVVKISEIIAENRARQVFLDVENRINHALAISVERHLEAPVTHRVEPGADRQHALRDIEANLAPLIDEPSAKILERLVEITVQ